MTTDPVLEEKKAWETITIAGHTAFVYPASFIEKIKNNLNEVPQGYLLELGCGCGAGGATVGSNHCIVGLDFNINDLKRGKERFEFINFILADAARPPFRDDCFEAVLSIDTLHHIKDLEGVFGEIYRILKDGGIFFAKEPSAWHPIALAFNLLIHILGRKRVAHWHLFNQSIYLIFGIGFFTPHDIPLSVISYANLAKKAGFQDGKLITCSALPSSLIEEHHSLSKVNSFLEKFPFLCGTFLFKSRKIHSRGKLKRG